MEFLIATHNMHKVDEFQRIFTPMNIFALTADITEAEETGTTFMENAIIKAKSACDETGKPAVADDSGLCIDFLSGEPGVYSARYAPEGQRKKAVLDKMKNVADDKRGAHFVSAIACVFPNGDMICCEGKCHGFITREVLGDKGFGYDPIFKVGDKTFAQMTAKEKDDISHRGIALREFEIKLKEYVENL
ncbi:MAG: RdgB/HAM1 family non-canonical purine NTP pyrophosphatase [Clostridia bacterium]